MGHHGGSIHDNMTMPLPVVGLDDSSDGDGAGISLLSMVALVSDGSGDSVVMMVLGWLT